MHSGRHIALEGASNFRDFGGYRAAGGTAVKWRRLFRSDRLSEMTATDYGRLSELGIRLVFDLRRDSEAAAAPTKWPGETAPTFVRSPLFNDETGLNTFQRIAADEAARHDAELARAVMSEMYFRLVTEAAPLVAYRQIFARLTEADAIPALFHCAGGKDRTGVVCALILSALGVDRDDIVDDFMLTQRFYASDANLRARITQIVAASDVGHWSEAALAPVFNVEAAYIERALDEVEKVGGIEAFMVKKVGISEKHLSRLQEELLTSSQTADQAGTEPSAGRTI